VSPPPPNEPPIPALRPGDAAGALHTLLALLSTAGAIRLSMSPSFAPWIAGQVLLALSFVKWFSLLHEAGHHTLFASRGMNVVAGHLASVITLLPFTSWKAVHRMHHRWTGWQDKDPTTSSLVPRPLGGFERAAINVAWRAWIPLFSLLYRAQSFWHLPRLFRLFPEPGARRAMTVNLVALLGLYVAALVIVGPGAIVRLSGVGLYLGFSWMDVIMLSQHTHIPLRLARGEDVAPIPAPEQAPFTRSLRFPAWISIGLLTGFDAHELHHVYPFVPGPRLRAIPWTPPNEAPAWAWIRAAKRVPAEVFLFKNRDTSGLSV
jgi:omega-6 fatty acid desaturase (delta-12 desaturase)